VKAGGKASVADVIKDKIEGRFARLVLMLDLFAELILFFVVIRRPSVRFLHLCKCRLADTDNMPQSCSLL